ncbi:MAG: hypothetical protein IPM79_06170 [Polyangiaceae bacterium]|nr:hypothetical protein [Polyangiaceae bacterium]
MIEKTSTAGSTNASAFRWEIATPFGCPVEPEVWRMYASAPSDTRASGAGARSSDGTSTSKPRASPARLAVGGAQRTTRSS